jgi:hypothetical protein
VTDIRDIEWRHMDLINLPKGGDQLKSLVNRAKHLRVLSNLGKFLNSRMIATQGLNKCSLSVMKRYNCIKLRTAAANKQHALVASYC